MGVSTDAKLFYGFLIEDESETHERIRNYDEDTDHGDSLAKLQWSGDSDGGVHIGYHSSDEYEQYYVAIEATELRAHRGHPKQIDGLEYNPAWDKQLTAFCKKHEIEPGRVGGGYVRIGDERAPEGVRMSEQHTKTCRYHGDGDWSCSIECQTAERIRTLERELAEARRALETANGQLLKYEADHLLLFACMDVFDEDAPDPVRAARARSIYRAVKQRVRDEAARSGEKGDNENG